MKAIEAVERPQLQARPTMRSGDTVRVHVKVREGEKERIQVFEGLVIAQHRGGARATFTVVSGIGSGILFVTGRPREADFPSSLVMPSNFLVSMHLR